MTPKASFLSPFRYPGGKTWLLPHIRLWLASKPCYSNAFVEPFAGGAIVGLTVANERLADHVFLVEIDEAVAAVWRVIINGEGDVNLLAERITNFKVNEQSVGAELGQSPGNLEDLAFQTILRNRISRGGIIAPGAGRLKRGEDDRGLGSRWYPETLVTRINRLVDLRERISFAQGDGLYAIKQFASHKEAVFFIDPPYTAGQSGAGTRLYTYPTIDHNALFRLVSEVDGDFLMTYDTNSEVQRLAALHNFDTEQICMTTTHNSPKTEILIGRDLAWIRQ